MTSISPYWVPCPLCRMEFEQLVLESTSSHAPPDLDTRPAPLARTAFVYDAAECPRCGFIFLPRPDYATEFVKDTAELRELLVSDAYLDCSRLSDPASRFRKAALIAEHFGAHGDAGWALLRAAWLCDDELAEDAAVTARLDAVEQLRAAIRCGQKVMDPDSAAGLLLADLLRRAGHFDDALVECEGAVGAIQDDALAAIIGQERSLIITRDRAAHQANAASR